MINWYIPFKPEMASVRYRCLIPGLLLNEMDIPDVTVVAKDWIHLDEVKAQKRPLIWDCCNDHFKNRKYYREIALIADAIVVPTVNMQERVKAETGRDSFIVEDPYEFPEAPPALRSRKAQRLFWYGHDNNLKGLLQQNDAFVGRELRIICNAPGYQPWSLPNMLDGFGWCDVVPIPVKPDPTSQAKSPNRMVEAIRQGRYVVANPLPAYKPYGMWQGDLKKGLEWVDNNPEEALEAVRKAQKIVEEKHSPQVIAAQWLEVFKHVT